jgi:hypothetical protein
MESTTSKRPVGRPRKEPIEIPVDISKAERARLLNAERARRSRLKKNQSLLETKAKIALLEQQCEALKTQINELTHSIDVYKSLVCKCGLDWRGMYLSLPDFQKEF